MNTIPALCRDIEDAGTGPAFYFFTSPSHPIMP